MQFHRIGERPGANGFGYFSRKKSDSRAQRVKALLMIQDSNSRSLTAFGMTTNASQAYL